MKRCEVCRRFDTSDIFYTIEDATSKHDYCPCCMVDKVRENYNFIPNDNFICDITGNRGAIKITSSFESYILNKNSLRRLIGTSLLPEEYHILVEKYDVNKFSLHEDFYDEDGIAVQPRIDNNGLYFY